MIVRSSSKNEDRESNSRAGQYDTVHGMAGLAAISQAIEQVIGSFAPGAIFYGLYASTPKMWPSTFLIRLDFASIVLVTGRRVRRHGTQPETPPSRRKARETVSFVA